MGHDEALRKPREVRVQPTDSAQRRMKALDPRHAESVEAFQSELRQALLFTFSRAQYRPPVLPAVAIHLVQLSYKADVRFKDLAELVESDPVLAADVLRLAQSSAYTGRGESRSLKDAIQRIGLQRSRDLFLRAAVEAKIFKANGFSEPLERLRHHSVATAEVARLICHQTKRDDEYAYLCGLLHDVGIAGAIIAIADDRILAQGIEFDLIWPALSSIYAQFTVQLAQLWLLPDELRTILRQHHMFAAEPEPLEMAAVSVLSEIIAAGVGYGFKNEQSDCLLDTVCARLRLTVGDLEEIEHQAVDVIAKALGTGADR